MSSKDDYGEYGFAAEYYDYVVPYTERNDVDFFVELARDTGGPVLELGCGTGRVLIPTAREGIEIVGLDSSEPMLSICRERVADEPESVRARVDIVKGDMRSFDLGKRFALATLPFRPFQHLTTVEDQLQCLKSIHSHLIDGGKMVVDLFNPSLQRLTDEDYEAEAGDEPEFTMPDGRRVLRRYRLTERDLSNQVLHCELIYYVTHTDGSKERLVHSFPMRYLFRYETEHLLARCGFAVESSYADFEKSPIGSKEVGELIFVARKL